MAGEGDVKLLGLLVNKGELLLKYNPVHKKVPVLIHNGVPLCESQIILQYIDEVWAADPSILPADPYERATARFWAAYVDDKLFPAWLGILKATTEEERAKKVKETLAVVEQLEVALAHCSNGKPFFAGVSVGFLDLVVGCNLLWFEALRRLFGVRFIVAGKTPLLASWAERFRGTDAAREVMPDADKAVEFAKMLMARLGSAPVAS